jgi:hypothetical protein
MFIRVQMWSSKTDRKSSPGGRTGLVSLRTNLDRTAAVDAVGKVARYKGVDLQTIVGAPTSLT